MTLLVFADVVLADECVVFFPTFIPCNLFNQGLQNIPEHVVIKAFPLILSLQVTCASPKMSGGWFPRKPGRNSSNIFQKPLNSRITKSAVPSARYLPNTPLLLTVNTGCVSGFPFQHGPVPWRRIKSPLVAAGNGGWV